ncbi:MAG TPA: LacI family DNA-binding transcriptional regulator [Opitutaceae bacterium]|nr:LacI family DNA-binding transcriptional regulator [Opitutaceae bacterium]
MGDKAGKRRAPATVRTIAKAAGVSIGSVSSVLNNRHLERRISIDTVEKIKAAAAKLGYLPNLSARRLRSHSTPRNSVVVALMTSFEAPIPLVNHFVAALRTTIAADLPYTISVVIEMFSAGKLREVPGLLTGDHFNAAIILNTISEDDQFLTRTKLPYPVVLVNRNVPGYASVIEDPQSGTRSAKLLLQHRRRKLAVLHGAPLTQITRTRVDSFMRQAGEALGQAPQEIVANRLSEEGGYEAMKAFLAKNKSAVDGVYAVSDALALGAYHAIKEHRLRLPQDIAVVGVGDYAIAPFFDPPLACVGVSHRVLAEEASAMLLRQLGQSAIPEERVVVPVVEVPRASLQKP